MYKKNLTMAMGRAIASSLLGVTPTIHASEHVFEISSIDQTQQLAAANDKNGETCTNAKIRRAQFASADDKR